MPQVEIKTRMRPMGRTGPELILEVLLVPRGSGNRKYAVALAKGFKNHPQLAPHVKRVRAGSSKVWVTLIPSAALIKTMWTWNAQSVEIEDVEGQLPLFGSPASA